MSIEKKRFLYEVLIRGKADGTIAGAHQVYAERVVDSETGDVLAEKTGGAEPLKVEDVGAVLGEAFATLAADLVAERAKVAAAESALAKAKADLEAARAANPVSAPSQVISDRQFAQGLAARNLITRAEALSFVQTGVLPSLLAAYVDGITDEAARFDTKMLLTGAKEFSRNHALVESMGAALGFSSADLDAFWSECAAL
jgi:hypothetical protein